MYVEPHPSVCPSSLLTSRFLAQPLRAVTECVHPDDSQPLVLVVWEVALGVVREADCAPPATPSEHCDSYVQSQHIQHRSFVAKRKSRLCVQVLSAT